MSSASVRVARNAMGTRFEILLCGENESYLRAAGEEALLEIERLERQLSLFRPDSELTRINSRASQGPVRVEPGLFSLLERCRELWQESGSAFDVTIAPLMECWGIRERRAESPSAEEVTRVREVVGMEHVLLNRAERTVSFDRAGVGLDLGAIAKGWALDEAALLLQEAGIENALLHGGTSTARAMGFPEPGAAGWKVAIRPPPADFLPDGKPWPDPFLRTVLLRDQALSVSGIAGRYVKRPTGVESHVLDPRNGSPVRKHLLAATVAPLATDCDALSTAILVGGLELQEQLHRSRTGGLSSLLLLHEEKGIPRVVARGL